MVDKGRHPIERLLERFQKWFFYILIFTPGIIYLEYIEKSNIEIYSGTLILILIAKLAFYGFLYVMLAIHLIIIERVINSKNKENINLSGSAWVILDDFDKKDMFERIVVLSLLFFLFNFMVYLSVKSLFLYQIPTWWTIYLAILIISIVILSLLRIFSNLPKNGRFNPIPLISPRSLTY